MGWLAAGLAVVAVLVAVALWPRLRAFGRQVHLERARELFKLQRERLEAQFLTAAAASGKPRGLRWKECQWDSAVEFARDNGRVFCYMITHAGKHPEPEPGHASTWSSEAE